MSKRVKTFDEKQRQLNPAEQAALDHMRKKSQGVKTKKNEVLTPEQLKLQDVAFSDEDKKILDGFDQGKIITPEMLEKEKKDKAEKIARFKEEFNRQLSEWIKEDHSSEYEWVDFDHEDYLVRIFRMDVREFEGFITLKYEWSRLHRNWKLADEPATDNVFPIVKILKVGAGVKSDKHKVGDICLVPSMDVIGEDWNPKFLHVMQFQNSQNMQPVLPQGMRQSIPNVEKNWDRYKFIRPWVPEPEDVDHLTYLIPEAKIRGSYKKA